MKPLWLNGYEVFLFDLDDTLFDHSEAYERGVINTIANFPLISNLDSAEFLRIFTSHNHNLWPKFASNEISFERFSSMRFENTLRDFNINIDGTPELLQQMVKTFQISYIQQIQPQTRTHRFLSDVSKYVKVGIVTNGTVFNAYEKVKRLGLDDIFPDTAIIVSERIGFAKPQIEIFEHALELFRVEACKALFIGDNYFTDISGADSIGMDTIWINKHDYECPGSVYPSYTVKHLLAMEELIYRKEWLR